MNRRYLLQTAVLSGIALAGTTRFVNATQTPVASPASEAYEEPPLDPRARQLIERLYAVSPLALLEALETGEVTDPILLDAAGDAVPTALPWHDPSDTDLEHALGGVMIVTNDESVNSPELAALGGYIVYESPDIAYDQLMRQMEGLEASMMSTSVAGAKVWIIDEEDMQLGVMRLANVFVMAFMPDHSGAVMEGMVLHLDAVTRGMA